MLHGDTVQVCSGPLSPASLLPTKSQRFQIALQRWAHCRGDILTAFLKKTGTGYLVNTNTTTVLNHRELGLSRISSGKLILLLISRMTRLQFSCGPCQHVSFCEHLSSL